MLTVGNVSLSSGEIRNIILNQRESVKTTESSLWDRIRNFFSGGAKRQVIDKLITDMRDPQNHAKGHLNFLHNFECLWRNADPGQSHQFRLEVILGRGEQPDPGNGGGEIAGQADAAVAYAKRAGELARGHAVLRVTIGEEEVAACEIVAPEGTAEELLAYEGLAELRRLAQHNAGAGILTDCVPVHEINVMLRSLSDDRRPFEGVRERYGDCMRTAERRVFDRWSEKIEKNDQLAGEGASINVASSYVPEEHALAALKALDRRWTYKMPAEGDGSRKLAVNQVGGDAAGWRGVSVDALVKRDASFNGASLKDMLEQGADFSGVKLRSLLVRGIDCKGAPLRQLQERIGDGARRNAGSGSFDGLSLMQIVDLGFDLSGFTPDDLQKFCQKHLTTDAASAVDRKVPLHRLIEARLNVADVEFQRLVQLYDPAGCVLADLLSRGVVVRGTQLRDLASSSIVLALAPIGKLCHEGMSLAGLTLDDLAALGVKLKGARLSGLLNAGLTLHRPASGHKKPELDTLVKAGLDPFFANFKQLIEAGCDLEGLYFEQAAAIFDLSSTTFDDLVKAGIVMDDVKASVLASLVSLEGTSVSALMVKLAGAGISVRDLCGHKVVLDNEDALELHEWGARFGGCLVRQLIDDKYVAVSDMPIKLLFEDGACFNGTTFVELQANGANFGGVSYAEILKQGPEFLKGTSISSLREAGVDFSGVSVSGLLTQQPELFDENAFVELVAAGADFQGVSIAQLKGPVSVKRAMELHASAAGLSLKELLVPPEGPGESPGPDWHGCALSDLLTQHAKVMDVPMSALVKHGIKLSGVNYPTLSRMIRFDNVLYADLVSIEMPCDDVPLTDLLPKVDFSSTHIRDLQTARFNFKGVQFTQLDSAGISFKEFEFKELNARIGCKGVSVPLLWAKEVKISHDEVQALVQRGGTPLAGNFGRGTRR